MCSYIVELHVPKIICAALVRLEVWGKQIFPLVLHDLLFIGMSSILTLARELYLQNIHDLYVFFQLLVYHLYKIRINI
jgi:hypothetical protein